MSLLTPSRTFAPAAILSLLIASTSTAAPPLRKDRSPASAPQRLEANDAIIPLPLNPIVPAAQRLCRSRTPSGLGFTMLRPGSGAKPAESDVVLVNYIGYFATTGAVFDQGVRSIFPVKDVIAGFSEGLQMMAPDGIARFCVSAALGYGAQATGPIPANTDLVFQVELLDHRAAAEVSDPSLEQPAASAAPEGSSRPR